jgi:hypothetical protein
MAENHVVSTKLKDTLDLAARCFEAEKSEGYEALLEQLEELHSLTQESVRARSDRGTIAKKLESGDALTPDEMNSLKLMLVGDADYYMKYDEDFDRSEGELKKIVDNIRSLQAGELDADAAMHLGVLCREACSVAKPTAFYLEQKERLHKFEEATRDGIDRETGKMLADILRGF